ncbi:MAG: hypothetical protein DRP62_07185 [Planctomycetota bacterium]|nr:MAG: hypothetical protein DRP62_07185 [Planctomycetota bacterium]
MCKGLIWLSVTNRRNNPKELYREIQEIPGIRNVYSSRRTRYGDLEQIVIEITEDPQELGEIVSDNIDELVDTMVQKKNIRSPSTVSFLISRYENILEWLKERLNKIDAVRDVKVVERLDIE